MFKILSVVALLALTGCATNQQSGALAGAAVGAATGKVLGGQGGAAVGAVIGTAIGSNMGAALDQPIIVQNPAVPGPMNPNPAPIVVSPAEVRSYPPSVVYVQPWYPSPGPYWYWSYHSRLGWGYYHPRHRHFHHRHR